MPQSYDLRLLLRQADEHAVYVAVRLQGEDLYYIQPVDPDFDLSSLAGLNEHEPLFKVSHHKYGQSHVQIKGRMAAPPEQRFRLRDLKGYSHIGSASGMSEFVTWGYVPKAESRRRRNLVLDAETLIDVPWAADLWVVEQGCPDLVDEVLRLVEEHYELIGHSLTEDSNPQILLVALKMRREALEEFWAMIRNSPPETRPRGSVALSVPWK